MPEKNKEKDTRSYDQEKDQLFWLTKEVGSAQMSPLCLAVSPTTDRRGMVVFVEGRDRLPHSSAIHHPQHFVPVNEVQKGKHRELQKDRKTLECLSQLHNF